MIIEQKPSKSNSIGRVRFVLALIALLLCWAPFLNWLLWLLSLILSGVGITKQPRVAGLDISLLGLIIIVFVLSFFAALGH
jgi:hypothetical protein